MSDRGHTRGQFLGAGAALSGAALASSWRVPAASAQEVEPLSTQGGDVVEGAFGPEFFGENFHLELGGQSAGHVTDVQGGLPVAEVFENDLPGGVTKKTISSVKFSEVSFKFALPPSGTLMNWLRGTLDREQPAISGSIKAADADLRVTHQGFFSQAIITEIGFPAMDATVKGFTDITIKFQATTKMNSATGTIPPPSKTGATSFKFEAAGLSSKAPVKIDAFAIKQQIVDAKGGGKEPGKIDFPNIKLSLAQNSGLSSWISFYENFLLEGNHADPNEVTGSLTVTNPKGTKTHAQMSFFNMGIVSATPVTEDGVRRVKAEMYCEDARFVSEG